MRPASLVAAAALAVLPAVTAAQLLDTRATYYAVGNLGRYDLGEMRNAQTFTAPAATLNGVTFVGDFWFQVTLQVQAGDAHAPSGPSLVT